MKTTGIFDWYGTLAHWSAETSNYRSVFQQYGNDVDEATIDAYHVRWDGFDHAEHSRSKLDYEAWTRTRLRTLVAECGITSVPHDEVIDALLLSDADATMACFPDAPVVLEELSNRGVQIGVCSNWGWELEPYLEQTGLRDYVDVVITSARAGYRKPHPGIYDVTLAKLGIDASSAVFVGDSWAPDVLGPSQAGMTAVHIVRSRTTMPPELIEGAHRIGRLEELLTLQLFGDEGGEAASG